jgi:O-antigen ligase
MIMLGSYLFFLMIAPQLWVPGILGLPVDFIIYPLWYLALIIRGRGHLLFKFELAEKIFAAFFAWIILSALVNGLTDDTREHIYIYLRIFVLYKAVSASVETTAEIRNALWIFVLLAVILAIEAISHKNSPDLLGWAGQKLGWVDPSVLEAGGTGRARWVGIFDGPGVFCVVFTIALGICLPRLSGGAQQSMRLLSVAVIALLCVATYLTGSRGGFLATLAILTMYIAVRRKIRMRSILAGGLLGLLLFSMAPESLTTMQDESRSAQHRVEMWAEGVEMVKQNPAFGIGRGNFKNYTGRLIAHNSAIEVAGETGIIGFILWCTMIYVSFKAAFLTWKNETGSADSNLGLGLMLALMGYLISAMFVTLEYETFYFLLALCVGLIRNQPAAQSLEMHEVVKIFVVVGVWLLLMQIFVIIYLS